jgi:[calcium/calmodulin-dependent protein kinase] kinase
MSSLPTVYTKLVKSKDAQGNKSLNGFKFIRKDIGAGAFSKVHLVAETKTNKQYAMKKMSRMQLKKKRLFTRDEEGRPKMSSALDKALLEIDLLAAITHPHVIRMHAVINDPQADDLCLMLEFAEKGQLMDWDGKACQYKSKLHPATPEGGLPLSVARKAFKELVSVLEYLHKKLMIHRDIKPDNILIFADTSVKLSDFGVAKQLKPSESNGMVSDSSGTPEFYSPEACSGDEYSAFAADFWALGVTLFAMAFGTVPWLAQGNETAQQIFDLVSEADLKFPEPAATTLDSAWKSLLTQMLAKDPTERPSLADIQAHPFFTTVDETA